MRISLSNKSLELISQRMVASGLTADGLASALSVSGRTIRDWKRGKFTIPEERFALLLELLEIEPKSIAVTRICEYVQKSHAGRLGGKAQWVKNRAIGTLDDKRKGGHASFNKRKDTQNDIFTKHTIRKPVPSVDLAEFLGIMIGDGGITKYQASIALNMRDDEAYAVYVRKLASQLFGIPATKVDRRKANCTVINLSSIELVHYLNTLGLPTGDKIRAGLDIPSWIKTEQELVKACLRGIFDTDGSIFLETHNIRERVYSYPRMSFVSASEPLRESICDALQRLGFDARIHMERSVNLERFTDIEKYFRMIGSSNPKHLSRFARFGGVA